ncbi:hypothetical protein BCR44DRAFT_40801, partial [Catenaria anguillulae PL171]
MSTRPSATATTTSTRQRQPSGTLDSLHIDSANMDIRPGDHVEYKHRTSVTTPSTGTIVSIITDKIHVGKRHFNATPTEPKILIQNDKTSKKTAYTPDHIIGLATAGDDDDSSN